MPASKGQMPLLFQMVFSFGMGIMVALFVVQSTTSFVPVPVAEEVKKVESVSETHETQQSNRLEMVGWLRLPGSKSNTFPDGYIAVYCDVVNGNIVYAGNSYSPNGGVSISAVPNGCEKSK